MEALNQQTETTKQVISKNELLEHWQGHRLLTRRVIQAFPEKDFFEFSIGGMRPMAELAMELLGIAAPGLREIINPGTTELQEHFDHGNRKEKILEKWDEETKLINKLWEQVPLEKFHKHQKIFGQYEGTGISHILYFIDNEIHHRGQGYVYLRALGIEPPFFWER